MTTRILLHRQDAAELRAVYASPGYQFPDLERRASRRLLRDFGLLNERRVSEWFVTDVGLAWLEANP